MNVNIALLTVTDTRTLETDKSGSPSIMAHQGVGILILTTLTLYLGIDTTFTVGISESISNSILSGDLK